MFYPHQLILRKIYSFLTFALCFSAAISHAADKPNIIIILLDDAGYADFGYMGSKDLETPQIDKLAASGVAFTDFHVSSTVCSPSRAGLITGRYQQRFGYECNIPPRGLGLDPAEITIAEALKDQGYNTYVVGKWHLGNDPVFHPNNHGFDEFYGFLEGGRSYFPDPVLDQPRNHRAILHNRSQVKFEGYLTDVFTDWAIKYIKESRDDPFFLYLSYNAVHTPMHAKDEHLSKYANHSRRELAAMTWSVDENIGRVLTTLEEHDLRENTLIFFFSDNGGAESNQSSNAPLKGWKGNKYEGGHRVPAIVSWPARIERGSWYHGLSGALDVFSTSLVAAGGKLSAHQQLDGADLVPLLASGSQKSAQEKLFWRKDRMAAMRYGSYKLVRLEGYGYRMYNLAEDFSESVDLRADEPGKFKAMIEAMADWENDLAMPLWYEGKDWSDVTWEIHYDLMNNQPVRFVDPAGMKAAQAAGH